MKWIVTTVKVYIIGGDGTQKGAWAIHKECVKRSLEVVVAGIPKTIDNDIDVSSHCEPHSICHLDCSR
jgi:6-phosphofructokinase